MSLHLAFCSHEAAKHACEHWHYSRAVPAGKLVKVGVWEHKKYIGAVIFGRGANQHMAKPYGLKQTEACELVRVALREHDAPVSKIVAVALRVLKKHNPGLKLVVSYADPVQGHRGGIYQAGNWLYVGVGEVQYNYWLKGKWVHGRSANSAVGSVKGLKRKQVPPKHIYLYPLDKRMISQLEPLIQPYPKTLAGEASL